MQATMPLESEVVRSVPRAQVIELGKRVHCVTPETLPPIADVARVVRTVLVADVVESVRLMQEDETGTVHRWRAFVDHVVRRLLPGQDGRLVKSLGDGMHGYGRRRTRVSSSFGIRTARSVLDSAWVRK